MVSANFTVESEQLGDGRIPNVAELFFDWVVGPFGGDNLANTEDAVSQTFVWERNGQSGCSYVDDSSSGRARARHRSWRPSLWPPATVRLFVVQRRSPTVTKQEGKTPPHKLDTEMGRRQ